MHSCELTMIVLVLRNPPKCSLSESILRALAIKRTFISQRIITTKTVYMAVLC